MKYTIQNSANNALGQKKRAPRENKKTVKKKLQTPCGIGVLSESRTLGEAKIG